MPAPSITDITAGYNYPNNGAAGSTPTQPCTWSHTCSSGVSALYVVIASEGGAGTPNFSAVTYGGTSMTRVGSDVLASTGSLNVNLSIWRLDSPAAGAATVSASFTAGNVITHIDAFSFSVTGAIAGGPEATHSASSTTAGTASSDSVTTLTNNALVISIQTNSTEYANSVDVGTLFVDQLDHATGGADGMRVSASDIAVASPGSQTFNWTTASPGYGRYVIRTLSIPSVAGNTLTLTDLPNFEVYQRIPVVTGTSANVPVAGTYTGTTPVTIEAQIINSGDSSVAQAWTPISGGTISGGSFSGGTLSVNVGGPYKLQVRSKDGGGTVLVTSNGSNTWCVGRRVAVGGSSTPEYSFSNHFTTNLTAPALAYIYDGTTRAAMSVGDGGIACATAMLADQPNVPIQFMNCGLAGSVLKGSWDTTSYSQYVTLKNACTGAGGGVSGNYVEFAYFHAGSNDARNSIVVSQSDHLSRLRTWFSNFRTDMSQSNLPIIFSHSQRDPNSGVDGSNDQSWSWVRAAELQAMDDANNYGIETYNEAITTDNIHPVDAGFQAMGRKIARIAKVNVYGIATGGQNWRGPKPISAAYNNSTGNLDVTFQIYAGTGIVTNDATNLKTAFQVLNNGAVSQTITSATIISPTVVRLVVPTGLGAGVTVQYATGRNPGTTSISQTAAGAAIYDNATTP